MSQTSRARLYFSFRSPYSWMALHRIAAALPEFARHLQLVPYWDPDPDTQAALRARGAELHYVQMSKAKHLYILQDTRRIARRLGLAMAWPIDIDPWWEVPHLAWLMAREQGHEARLYAALCEARWGRGANICDPAVLRTVADDAGLDGAALASAVDDPPTRAAAVDCLVQAYDDDVFGIPYGLVGRHRFWGLDRVDDLLAQLGDDTPPVQAVAAPRQRTRDVDPVGHHQPTKQEDADAEDAEGGNRESYDWDTAGGCG